MLVPRRGGARDSLSAEFASERHSDTENVSFIVVHALLGSVFLPQRPKNPPPPSLPASAVVTFSDALSVPVPYVFRAATLST